MALSAVFFYLFSSVLIAAAVMVIAARNPVHSVLWLILAFFNAAGLFILLGAEFLAMILVVVYVGAVAVLFMFVVMMLNINFAQLREGFQRYLPIGALVGFVLFAELVLIVGTWSFAADDTAGAQPVEAAEYPITNTEALGNLIYTDYFYLFQTAGAILLVAIIGAITLTHRKRAGTKRQSIFEQIHKGPMDTIEVRKVRSRSGI